MKHPATLNYAYSCKLLRKLTFIPPPPPPIWSQVKYCELMSPPPPPRDTPFDSMAHPSLALNAIDTIPRNLLAKNTKKAIYNGPKCDISKNCLYNHPLINMGKP